MGLDDFLRILTGRHHGGHHNNYYGDHHHGGHHRYYEDKRCDHIRDEYYNERKEGFLCPKCSAKIQPGNKFCPNCGVSLNSISQCKGCGARITPEASFCPECGLKLK